MRDPDLDRIIEDLRVRREKLEKLLRETFGLKRDDEQPPPRDEPEPRGGDDQQP